MTRTAALALAFAPLAAHAGAPLVLTHQGRLLDADGAAVHGAVDLRLTLYDQEASGAGFWTRLYADQPVEDGYFAVSLVTDDGGQPLDLDDFADGEVWVGVAVDGAALGPRERLGSVPFALVSGTSGAGTVQLESADGQRCLRLGLASAGYAITETAVDCDTGAEIGLVQVGGVWSLGGVALPSCKAYRDHPTYVAQGSGTYRIDPDGAGSNAPFDAYCEMATDGGGWTFFAHVNSDWQATRLFEQDIGTYRADRADNGATWGAGGRILPHLAHTEMMVALDSAAPSTAAAANKIVFYRYPVGHAGFNGGPVPCSGLTGFDYRLALTGAYTAGGTTNSCLTTEWYTRTVGNGAYLTLVHGGGAYGNYWGSGMGGNNSWNHDAWWYVR